MTTMAKETDAFSHVCYTQVFTVQHLPQYVCWFIQERFILKLRDQQITPQNIAKSDIDLILNRNYANICNTIHIKKN